MYRGIIEQWNNYVKVYKQGLPYDRCKQGWVGEKMVFSPFSLPFVSLVSLLSQFSLLLLPLIFPSLSLLPFLSPRFCLSSPRPLSHDPKTLSIPTKISWLLHPCIQIVRAVSLRSKYDHMQGRWAAPIRLAFWEIICMLISILYNNNTRHVFISK